MISITRKFQKVHIDLWGPHDPTSISRKNYIGLLLDELLLSRAEICKYKLDCLQSDGRGEFISTALQSFCQEREIKIGYTAPYMHKENGLVERYWKILLQIKNSILIDSKLPNKFRAEAIDITSYL